ncbi:MAG: tetratricopeptide repeat protein [bacterium]|nr:tetratricopeptide repeat protein [bacterium]
MLGRKKDLAALKECLAAPGFAVTVKGAPGIGKTTLGRALVRDKEMVARYGDGCYFISLEGVETKENLVLQMATRLVGAQAGADEQVLLDYLADKRVLVVLDNFEETLKDRTATVGFLTRLAAACPAAAIVCTSREAMNATAFEKIHKLGRLDRDSSRELLLSRSQVGGYEKEDLDLLLDELDDMPLAIILAAPYLEYGVDKLLAEIKSRGAWALRILGIDESDAQKDPSLERSFGLSYRTIAGTDAEMLFLVASLFPAGFSEGDISAILPRLSFSCFITLESKSLLVRDREGYSMVTPLRYYARQLLDASPEKRDWLRLWFRLMKSKAREYEDAVMGKGTKSIDLLVDRLPNIYLCLDELLVLGKNHKGTLFKIVYAMSDFFHFRGITASALFYLIAAKDIAIETEDSFNEAECKRRLGEIYFYASCHEEAKGCFEEALPLFRNVGQVLGEANCTFSLGKIHFRESRTDDAKGCFEEALSLFRDVEDVLGEANCIRCIGDIHFRESRNDAAKSCFEEVLSLFRDVGDVLGEAGCAFRLGEIHFREFRNEAAKSCFEEALPLFRTVGDVFGEANCTLSIAQIHIKENNINKGKRGLEKALSLYEKINDTYSIATAYYQCALLLKAHPGHSGEAEEMARKAAGLFKTIKLPRSVEKCEKIYVRK